MATTPKETRRVDRSWRGARPAPPPALLRFYSDGGRLLYGLHTLRGGEVTVGRDAGCGVPLDDDEVSRVHARLVRGSRRTWSLEDLGSANGTHVQGQPVTRLDLRGGEVLRLGGTLLRFLSPGPEAPPAGSARRRTDAGGMVAGPAMDPVLALLDRAAGSDINLLIGGETGTGKELAARHLHRAGPRRRGPFVEVNCGAIPATLFESELFGHRKGAFTGASQDNTGHLRRAHGGTLLLDEIGELPLVDQPKLLRVLQDRRVLPVGGDRPIPVDVRVVCATNRELGPMVEQGRFRVDLFARISELVVQLPPLRHRREEVPALVRHFLTKHGDPGRWPLDLEVLEDLCCRPWPRNIRQLENCVRRALLLAGPGPLDRHHFAGQGGGPADGAAAHAEPAAPDRPVEDPPQARRLREVLTRCQGDVAEAAELLGISVSQVYRRARKYGVRPAHYRP